MKGVTFPDGKEELRDNIDLLGNSANKYAEIVTGHVMENGFCASMNDYSATADRPFVRLVKPTEFVSFKHSNDKGYPQFSQFIFKEEIEVDDPDDEFGSLSVNQFTVLDLSENKDNKNLSNYRVRIFQGVTEVDKSMTVPVTREKMKLMTVSFPKMDGKYFDYIAIKIHGIEANNHSVGKSLLQDVSDMNISVLQRVVDQTYMLHWTALPTPYITGSDGTDDEDPDTIGPSKIWYISNPESKVGMLEFTGNSARAHQDFVDNLLYLMSVMGAQILKKEGVSRETATSVLVRTSAQTSLVATMVNNVSGQLQEVYKLQFNWGKAVVVEKEFGYKLNEDFLKVDMEPNAQIALVKSWLDGAISYPSVFAKMKEGELIDPNKTMEEELDDINKFKPPFFEKENDQKNNLALAESAFENQLKLPTVQKDPANKDETKGSNLDNGNVDNRTK